MMMREIIEIGSIHMHTRHYNKRNMIEMFRQFDTFILQS